MPGDCSRLEAEATLADYLTMLESEIRGEPYSKAEHRRALQPLLNDRSEGAIEYKHQNISAVLIDLGYPYIDGYKPAFNYQQLLFEVVADRLQGYERARFVHACKPNLADRIEHTSAVAGALDRTLRLEATAYVGRVR